MNERATAALNRAVLADHLRTVLAVHEIGLVVDVGAHTGQYGTLLRGIGYGGPIVSYEPVAETFEALVEASAGDEAWTPHRLALGSSDRVSVIRVSRSTDFSSFRDRSAFGAAAFPELSVVDREEEVEVRRLDAVFDEHAAGAEGSAPPALLKLDTQGWDLEVLAGADGVLDRIAVIQTETAVQPIYDGMPLLSEVLADLDARGFVPSGFFPVTRDSGARLIELDVVAVRRRH